MKKKFIVIEARNIYGLFSNFLHTLQHLHSSELDNMIPIVYWTGGIYAQKDKYRGVEENIWEYYFERVSNYSIEDIDINGNNVIRVKKYRVKSLESEPRGCWHWKGVPPEVCLNSPDMESRIFVNNIINKYIVIRKEIQEKIDLFYENNMEGSNVLGVHFRYCNDFRGPQGKDPIGKMTNAIRKYVSTNNDAKIFLATDFKPFLKSIKKEFGERVIHTKSARSKNGNPVQYAFKKTKLRTPVGGLVGEEVLIDCKLLSKCGCLYRGISNVASVATYWNPDIKYKCIVGGKL